MNIAFNKATLSDTTLSYVSQVLKSRQLGGNGKFTKLCQNFFANKFGATHNLLTTSGSSALDMAAHLIGIKEGDEVIMPSYTFSSTANAFVGVGARIVFVDIRPDTMNIDEKLIEKAITEKTRAIVVVHYAGVACEMDTICDIAARYKLTIIEDAAQAVMSKYKAQYLGTIGDYGCYSFHTTKNYSMGEGGGIIVKDSDKFKLAEIMWEKGTDRSQFMRGEIDKYTWVDWGSSYLPSELNAAYLWSQLEVAEEINNNRCKAYDHYYELLKPFAEEGFITLPYVPKECKHNAHIFYIKTRNSSEQIKLLNFLKRKGINAVFHYIPLHSSFAGRKYGRFSGVDIYTTSESSKLVRLPLFYGISTETIDYVVDAIEKFYE